MIGWLYQVDLVEFPAHLSEVTFGGFGYPVGEIDCDLPRVGVYFCERVSKSGHGDRVSIGIEGSDDGTFVVLFRGRVGVLGRRNVIAGMRGYQEIGRRKRVDAYISTNESKMVTTGS